LLIKLLLGVIDRTAMIMEHRWMYGVAQNEVEHLIIIWQNVQASRCKSSFAVMRNASCACEILFFGDLRVIDFINILRWLSTCAWCT